MEATNPDYTSIFIFIGGIFWTIMSGVTIYLFTKVGTLGERVQRVEDIQGTKLDRLTKDFEDFRREAKEDKEELKKEMKNIADQIHKEKNFEMQLNTTLGLLLKELTERHESRN